jgi:hypothetical protein
MEIHALPEMVRQPTLNFEVIEEPFKNLQTNPVS